MTRTEALLRERNALHGADKASDAIMRLETMAIVLTTQPSDCNAGIPQRSEECPRRYPI